MFLAVIIFILFLNLERLIEPKYRILELQSYYAALLTLLMVLFRLRGHPPPHIFFQRQTFNSYPKLRNTTLLSGRGLDGLLSTIEIGVDFAPFGKESVGIFRARTADIIGGDLTDLVEGILFGAASRRPRLRLNPLLTQLSTFISLLAIYNYYINHSSKGYP